MCASPGNRWCPLTRGWNSVTSVRSPGNAASCPLLESLDVGANFLWQSRRPQESWHPMSTLRASDLGCRLLHRNMRLQTAGSTIPAFAPCRRQPSQDGRLEREVRDFHSACSGHRIPCSSRRSRRKLSSPSAAVQHCFNSPLQSCLLQALLSHRHSD